MTDTKAQNEVKPLRELEIREWVKSWLGNDQSTTAATMREVIVEAIQKWEHRPDLLRERDALRDALQAAQEHLEFCGYGDKWERECAQEAKLEERIAAALSNSEPGKAI